MTKIGFEAKILKIETKSLVCGTKATRITLEFDSDKMNDVLDSLNKLQRADQNVGVAFAEISKNG